MTSTTAAPSAPVSVARARQVLLSAISPLPPETVDLGDALGRVLAADVAAATDLPAQDNSAMDGYAMCAADIAGATQDSPQTLPVGAEARAGAPRVGHRPGTATVIATGAALPAGADTVVPVENTSMSPSGVLFSAPSTLGRYVRRRGEDVSAGTTVVRAGRRLRSVDVGACASAGVASVTVGCRPRVALLGTGDELVPAGVVPLPHQVTDINGPMIAAAVREAGGVVVMNATVRDDPAAVSEALERAATSADLIVSSAGVSMGGHDHVRDCVARLGAVDLWTVAMRPGRPLVVGRVGDTPFLGLPGNPVSSAVTFLLFARAAILALQGAATLLPPLQPVTLAFDAEKPAHLETYLRVQLRTEDGRLLAFSSGGQGSAMMHGLASSDALVLLPAGRAAFPTGCIVEAMLLP